MDIMTFRGMQFDLSRGRDISIAFREGKQVNCYYAPPFSTEVIRMGSFVGDVSLGGPVNYRNVRLNPHGNGTHTECLGHITAHGPDMAVLLKRWHFIAELRSVTPEMLANGDKVIQQEQLTGLMKGAEALILRTLPNTDEKRTLQYSGSNPPYLSADAAAFLRDSGIEHLLIDLPSVDREEDDGALAAHRAFWDMDQNPRIEATITELIYVPEEIPDGHYLLNLMISPMAMDAAPSRPVIFPEVRN